MPPDTRHPVFRYAVVPLAVALALLLRWALWPVLGDELAFLFFWPVVMVCAWSGGQGPGLLATLLSSLAAAFFLLEPRFSFAVGRPPELVGMAMFVLLGAAISLLTESLHRRRQEVERHAEEVTRQRERLRVSLASIGDAVIAVDTEGRVEFVNPTAEALTGWASAEALGQPLEAVFRIVNEQTRQPAESPVVRVLREGVVVGLANHTALVARDGTERPIEDSAAPIKGEDGSILGVILVFHDVTEKRRAAKALRESEEQFRSSFELAAVGKVQIDPATGRFLRVNRKFCEITGYGPDELRGLTPRDITHPEDREEDWKAVGRMLSGEVPIYSADKRYVRKDGRPVWVNVTATLVRDADGKPARTIGVVQDLTARRAAEEALREAARRKDEFLAVLAHELRNPLAPLRTGLHLLRGACPAVPAQERALAMMQRQLTHLARLVDDLLDVSRVTHGRVQLRRERLDLARLVRTTADDYGGLCEEAGVEVRVDAPETPAWVMGDATRLAQVVWNLLHNACKFTARGGRVEVRVEADPVGRDVAVRVRDTGVGIEADLLPRLFEPFSQADRSLERTKGGLGLGLALVKGLAELHGGRAEAFSRGPGHGAEFVVRLPLEAEPDALAGSPPSPSPSGGRLRVLVIEDNRDAADSLRLLLELQGHEVEVTYSGPDGVRMAAGWGPDVVLSDIGLPGLDGFGVAREVRGNPATARARLIAVTGYGGDEDRRRARESGFDHVLTKPADPADLLRLVAHPA